MSLYQPGSRLTAWQPFTFPATIGQILGPNEKRIGVWLIGRPDVAVQYAPGAGFGGHQAFNIPAQSGPIYLTIENFGEGLKKSWFAVTDTGVTVGGMIVEVIDNT